MNPTDDPLPPSGEPRRDTTEITLAECEKAIERSLKSFEATGNALRKIRDRQLYRPPHTTYKTFEEYCLERWGFSRGSANDLTGGCRGRGDCSKF